MSSNGEQEIPDVTNNFAAKKKKFPVSFINVYCFSDNPLNFNVSKSINNNHQICISNTKQ